MIRRNFITNCLGGLLGTLTYGIFNKTPSKESTNCQCSPQDWKTIEFIVFFPPSNMIGYVGEPIKLQKILMKSICRKCNKMTQYDDIKDISMIWGSDSSDNVQQSNTTQYIIERNE